MASDPVRPLETLLIALVAATNLLGWYGDRIAFFQYF